MSTTTQDKKAIYKAQTVAGKPMDRHVGEEFVISDVVQFEAEVTRKNRDGEQVTEMAVATTIFAQNGDMFTTVSPTIDNCLKSMYNFFGDDIKGLAVRITSRREKNNSFDDFMKYSVPVDAEESTDNVG